MRPPADISPAPHWSSGVRGRLASSAQQEENHEFLSDEPFNTAKASSIHGPDGFRLFLVEVEADAPNFATGTTLVRDPHWVGGLKIDVMGWTGPLAEGSTPFAVKGSFPGHYVPQIVVSGSNGTRLIPVKAIPAEESDDYVRQLAG